MWRPRRRKLGWQRLPLERVKLAPVEGGGLQFIEGKEVLAEVRPWGQGVLVRFGPLGPLPASVAPELSKVILAQTPGARVVFELPKRGRIPPLWSCPREGGCATGATVVAKGVRLAVPAAWMGSLEKCWESARPAGHRFLPDLTLKVRSRLGPRVVDLAAGMARSGGEVYTAPCLTDEAGRLQTWLTMHLASRASRAGRAPRSLVDAWGAPIAVEGPAEAPIYASLGADGAPGGTGLGADFRYPEPEEE